MGTCKIFIGRWSLEHLCRSVDLCFTTTTVLQLSSSLSTEVLEAADPPDAAVLPYIMHLLALEDIPGLPPGGGLSSK